MEKTAKILQKHCYPCTYAGTKVIKGVATPVRVYTVSEPERPVQNPIHFRRGSIPANIHSLDQVVRLLSNPKIRQHIKNTSISEDET